MDEFTAALPAVQEAVRKEIAERIAAGEDIAAIDTDWGRCSGPQAKIDARRAGLLRSAGRRSTNWTILR